MKIISTKMHGILDYLIGILLVALSWIFNFDDLALASNIPSTLGMVMLIMSILTNYEPGLIKIISMKKHLTIDFLSGLFLALSPWLFSFYGYVYLPHLIFGIVKMGSALMTKTTPDYSYKYKQIY